MSRLNRDLAVISCHCKDLLWLERLRVHLDPILRKAKLSAWSTTQVLAGDDVQAEVALAISRASVVVLIISADYLASQEMMSTVDRVVAQGIKVCWLHVRPSGYMETALVCIPSLLEPYPPLSLLPQEEAEAQLVQAAKRISQAASISEFDFHKCAEWQPSISSRKVYDNNTPAITLSAQSDVRIRKTQILSLALVFLVGTSIFLHNVFQSFKNNRTTAGHQPIYAHAENKTLAEPYAVSNNVQSDANIPSPILKRSKEIAHDQNSFTEKHSVKKTSMEAINSNTSHGGGSVCTPSPRYAAWSAAQMKLRAGTLASTDKIAALEILCSIPTRDSDLWFDIGVLACELRDKNLIQDAYKAINEPMREEFKKRCSLIH